MNINFGWATLGLAFICLLVLLFYWWLKATGQLNKINRNK
jgi:hypothetical protein